MEIAGLIFLCGCDLGRKSAINVTETDIFPNFRGFKFQFIVLFAAAGAMPSPGEKVAERSEVGCGMRETRLDAVEGKGLLKSYPFISLIHLPHRRLTARIPHQSAARTSHADSFSPGEAKGAAAP